MNSMIKMWLVMGLMDLTITIFAYFMLIGTWFVYFSVVPTIFLLIIGLPLQRIGNQINKGYQRQNGKCYNCNLQMNENTCTLEDNDHVYCKACHTVLFGHLYEERGGISYRKDDKKLKNGDNK